MLSAFSNSLKIPELRQRIFFTLGMVFVCRLIEAVPTPGIDPGALQRVIAEIDRQVGGGFLSFIDLFSGGALSRCAVGALGIMPYISASIILQMMTAIIPTLERLAREGDTGRQKLSQYTRYLTIVICAIQGFVLALTLERPGSLGINEILVPSPGWEFRIMTVIAQIAGTMLMMWIGEQITERGIGNGISLVITVNIVSRLPSAVFAAIKMFTPVEGVAQFTIFHLIGLVVMFFLVVAATISLTQAQRKIPINTTKRVIGRKVYGGQNTYMPLRVNYSGVMPIIFSSVMLAFPAAILRQMPWDFAKTLGVAFNIGEPLYVTTDALLILFFSYFWVATQFNPLQIADDLKRNGGYVPGIRPGRPTGEYLDKTMTRITLIGAIFLTAIAIMPSIMARQFAVPWLVASFFGGTSLLIIVGVILDTMRQVESHLLMRNYDGFLRKGKLRSRR
ncbi:MAG: preprotein translocase subunit SecY [Kiritimatiellae bacterium]|nr:preprotein translocase subunit SecY [Kiritimatiellia bacterium]MDD5522247.1 preprotein translocase subunit SecY [Kiritimatiellia bacterium]